MVLADPSQLTRYVDQDGKLTPEGWLWFRSLVDYVRSLTGLETVEFASRDEFVTAVGDSFEPPIGTTASDGQVTYIYDGGTSIADLPGWAPFGDVYVDHFGAVGDYTSAADTGTDDRAAIQAAIDYLNARSGSSGGTLHYRRSHLVMGTVVLKGGVTLRGQGTLGGIQQVGAPEWPDPYPLAPGIIGGHTSGPVILCGVSDCGVSDAYIGATAARWGASISTGDQNTNCGVLIESPTSGTPVVRTSCTNVMVRNQPADGIAVVGVAATTLLDRCVLINNERHGLLINSGTMTGRTTPAAPGIVNVHVPRVVNSGGHAICVGDNAGVGFLPPYRVWIVNAETFRSGHNPGHLINSASVYARGQDIAFISCAFGATSGFSSGDAAASLDYSIAVSGWDIRLEACRYIEYVDAPLLVFFTAGIACRGIIVEGGNPQTTETPPEYFLDLTASSVDGLWVRGVFGDFTGDILDASSLTDDHQNVIYYQAGVEQRWNVKSSELVSDVIRAREVTIADDSVYEIEFTGTSCSGVLEFNSGSGASGAYGRVRFRVGSSAYCRVVESDAVTVNVGTTTLTGTTGADAAFNVAATSGNKLMLENRTGASQSLTLTLTSIRTSAGHPID
jgi:hypothetical protein